MVPCILKKEPNSRLLLLTFTTRFPFGVETMNSWQDDAPARAQSRTASFIVRSPNSNAPTMPPPGSTMLPERFRLHTRVHRHHGLLHSVLSHVRRTTLGRLRDRYRLSPQRGLRRSAFGTLSQRCITSRRK